jgi:DNA-binding helix-hairpin-helix protein with protein kinase domain
MILRRQHDRTRLRPGTLVGHGGEGDVFQVEDDPSIVDKLYHQPTPYRAAKLRAMLQAVPEDPSDAVGHAAIAWPMDLAVDDATEAVVGFVMPRLDATTNLALLNVYNPGSRRAVAPGFTWRYLLHTAANLASVVEALHQRGYVIGDLNESNLFVSNSALVTLIDCDSIQVPAPGASVMFRCGVGKPEYTAPELQHVDLGRIDRTPDHDNFALAIVILLLLMEGVHPFSGVWLGPGVPPTIPQNIQTGDSPYVRPRRIAPAPHAPAFETFPPDVQHLVLRCFGDGFTDPTARPSAAEWEWALREAEATLLVCEVNPRHEFAAHLSACPWCLRQHTGLPDAFPPPTAALSAPAAHHQPAPSPTPSRRAGWRRAAAGAAALVGVMALVLVAGTHLSHGGASASPAPTAVVVAKPTSIPYTIPPSPYCPADQVPQWDRAFVPLKQVLGDTMGEPVECVHPNPDNGDALQRTTSGLAVFDQRRGEPVFTDGWRHWALSPQGPVYWEGTDS